MRTSARRGDSYLVNGTKTWITNARRSGLIALLCKTDPAAGRHAGSASCWPSTDRGSRSPATSPSSATRGGELRAVFDDFRVPADALLGGREGEGSAR